ncbi:MAG TPA: class I SAM-dependent methyltransferase [Candidatus Bathyarchaeia archaeon]|nr:class I SAM-dependent methyltransferase [Candidatus Bathyarchaeia archaeon]
MKAINPLSVLLWTFRRNESDVVNLYDTLSSLMQISTGGNMLNFGHWNKNTTNPLEAQNSLCNIVGDMADLKSATTVLDVGSGFSEPALLWKSEFPHIDLLCMNVNLSQLQFGSRLITMSLTSQGSDHEINRLGLVNATSIKIPLKDNSVDRVIALESAQHFKPLNEFVSESKRILKNNGSLVMAIPTVSSELRAPEILKLGILSFTWSSEHYQYKEIEKIILKNNFQISDKRFIGANVYAPLADYYIKNRETLKTKILEKYPAIVEKILFKSMIKMKEVSQKGIIDYILLKCTSE